MKDFRSIPPYTIGLQARDATERRIRISADRVLLGSMESAEGVILDITKQRDQLSRLERNVTVLSPIEALDLATRLQAVALQYLTLKG